MAYDDPSQPKGDENEMPGESSGEPSEDTFFISKDALGGDYKIGDVEKFKIVGEDSEGNWEVECLGDGGSGSSWKTDLRKHMATSAEDEGM